MMRCSRAQRLGHEPAALVRARDLVAQVAGEERSAHDVGVVARAHDLGIEGARRRLQHEARRAPRRVLVDRGAEAVAPERLGEEGARGRRRPAIEVPFEILREEARHGGLHARAHEAQRQPFGAQFRQLGHPAPCLRTRTRATAGSSCPSARA
jgi:hypothetical protein